MPSSSATSAASPTQFNLEAIARLEEEALQRRTVLERMSETIARVIGSMPFLLLHTAAIAVWLVVNLGLIPAVKPFDPFPFGILPATVSIESLFLTIFVLISQNRMMRQAEKRSHLHLQVGMLAEQELTTVLQMLHNICQHMGVDVGPGKDQIQKFTNATDVHELASELDQKLP